MKRAPVMLSLLLGLERKLAKPVSLTGCFLLRPQIVECVEGALYGGAQAPPFPERHSTFSQPAR